MDDLTAAIQEFSATVGAVKSTVDNSEAILMDMVAWKPHMDGAMSEMCADINVLRQQLGRVAPHPVLTMDPDLLRERAAPSSLDGAGGEMAFGDSGRGPAGHRRSTQPRGLSLESDLALPMPPVMGTSFKPDRILPSFNLCGVQCRGGHASSGSFVSWPRMDFPRFEGERPKSWKRQCKSYFCVFSVSHEHWVDTDAYKMQI
jgi:hypothetical protein